MNLLFRTHDFTNGTFQIFLITPFIRLTTLFGFSYSHFIDIVIVIFRQWRMVHQIYVF